jgi:hypothetical protein
MSENDKVSSEVQKMMDELIRENDLPPIDPTKEFTVKMYHEELKRQGIQVTCRSATNRLEALRESGVLTKRRVIHSGKSAMAYSKVKDG